MPSDLSTVPERIEPIASGVVAAEALSVDRDGRFPEASIAALSEAGYLGLLTEPAHGGSGGGLADAALVVERLARECGSTAMVMCMHYCGVAVIERYGADHTRQAIGAGRHLTTLAFSETGSRSHFWAPVSTATAGGDGALLDARKSWVTSATKADSYVWSSRPMAADGMSTIWLVPRETEGITFPAGSFDGMGLRGNDSQPVAATSASLPAGNMLGADGAGFDVMMGSVLPIFSVLTAATSIGLMEGAIARTTQHAAGTRYEHSGEALADLPTIRNYIARMRVRADSARALWLDTITACEDGREDATLRVLECKAAAGEAAVDVLATAMRVCGGAAFRKEVGVERYYRDAAAQGVMGPTTDVLYDFIGKAVTGLPLF